MGKADIRNPGIIVPRIKGIIVYGGLGFNDFRLKSCIFQVA